MREMTDENWMIGRLFCLKNALCGIEPQGRDNVDQCIKTLKAYRDLLGQLVVKAPEDHSDFYSSQIDDVYARIEDMMEKRNIYGGDFEEKVKRISEMTGLRMKIVGHAEGLDQCNDLNKLWDLFETMQEKINELEGRIKRLGG
jgi:hypothetical protein